MKKLFFLSLLLSSLLSKTSWAQRSICNAGLGAFQAHVHGFIGSSKCYGCHAGNNAAAPVWAGANEAQSYGRIKGYVDFSNIGASKIINRAGNGHCGTECQDQKFVAQLANRIGEWWLNGESDCQNYQVSNTVTVPSNLSTTTYQIISWSLDPIGSEFSGISFNAEIKAIPATEVGQVAGYLITKPKIVFGQNSSTVKLKDVRIFVNGKAQWFANQYESISATVNQSDSPVLSTAVVMVEGGVPGADQLTIGIKEIDVL